MTAAIIFTALIPAALLGVLGLVLLGERLSAGAKTRIERGLSIALYGGLSVSMGVRAVEKTAEQDWLMAALMAASAVIFAVYGVRAVQRGRVFRSEAAAK